MKILVVTNLYPPHHVGGYELGCRDIVEQLRRRGHEVRVLTSTFRHANQADDRRHRTPNMEATETGVERILQFTTDSTPQQQRSSTLQECKIFARVLADFSPRVVYFFNQAGLCRWLPVAARAL